MCSSDLIWILFISFSSPIAMARTPKTMLNNSGESGHTCLVPNFSVKALFFTVEYYVGCGFVINSFCYA